MGPEPRARQELIVFSGFTADQIDPSRTKALAVNHLKTFLDYAERGAIALPAQDRGSVGGFDSPFEEAVAAQLERRGWMVVPQVGISGFRIDLGIRHPDLAGSYLAGVECDGATYHGSATARDRDKVREQVLRGLGWNILRVWSTDWWLDAKGCAERLHENLEALLQESRERRASDDSAAETHWDIGHEVEGNEEIRDEELPAEIEVAPPCGADESELVSASDGMLPDAPVTSVASAVAVATTPIGNAGYSVTDLSTLNAEPDLFFEFAYRDTLRGMIEAVMKEESPLPADVLAQRIARAHGWLRTGGRIRERIDLHLRGYDTKDLFGKRVGAAITSLCEVLKNAAAYASSSPDRLAKLLDSLFDIEGRNDNLRGILFELIAGYLARLDAVSIDMSLKATDPTTGKTADIDVQKITHQTKSVTAIECKGKEPGGILSLEEVETWLTKIAIIRAHYRHHPTLREALHSFEIWTSGTIAPDALAKLEEEKTKRVKSPIGWKDGQAVLSLTKSSKEKGISDALYQHYIRHPLAEVASALEADAASKAAGPYFPADVQSTPPIKVIIRTKVPSNEHIDRNL